MLKDIDHCAKQKNRCSNEAIRCDGRCDVFGKVSAAAIDCW